MLLYDANAVVIIVILYFLGLSWGIMHVATFICCLKVHLQFWQLVPTVNWDCLLG